MDRQTVYYGALAQETDLLRTNQNAMIGLARNVETILGATTLVDGFTCIPTTPASLNVLVTPGTIYSLQNLEATSWSSLAQDLAHSIAKQGIVLDNTTLGITPPGTVGFSQVFLVQVQYQDLDTAPVVLPYYNSGNPTQPFLGPNNTGVSQNTVRKGIAAIQIKAGTAAATGTQSTPTADAGWTGLFAITVANGATTITSGNIATLVSAPFLATNGKLPLIPKGVQDGTWVYAVDTGTADALVISPLPQPTAYVAGQAWFIKKGPASNATATPTVNVTGPSGLLGAKTIVRADGSTLRKNDLPANGLIELRYDGVNARLMSVAGQVQQFIDTAVVKTVHGGGADFPDLFAALDWATHYLITVNGSLTFQLPTGQFIYTSAITFDHPNANRIVIKGNGAVATPVAANFQVTGSSSGARATDNAVSLGNLRACYNTEIRFTGALAGATFAIAHLTNAVGWQDMLITGDGTAGPGGMLPDGGTNINRVSIHGFNGIGFQARGALCNLQTWFSVSGCGVGLSTQSGLIVYNGSMLFNSNGAQGMNIAPGIVLTSGASALYARGNGDSGISIAGGYLTHPGLFAENNAVHGVLITQGTANGGGSYQNNGQWGVKIVQGRYTTLSSVFAGNTSGPILATDGAFADTTGAGSTVGFSPAANTVGNSNSYIKN